MTAIARMQRYINKLAGAPPARAALAMIAATCFAAMAAPPTAFSIDDVVYADMANAMASRGALDVTAKDTPPGAPLLTKNDALIHMIDGEAVPQYPSGYAIIAAPFFAALDLRGLILMNALGGLAAFFLFRAMARRLGEDAQTINWASIILIAATFISNYWLAIWPHMSALVCALAGAYLSLRAGDVASRRRALAALVAGFIFGLGVHLRLDTIFLAGAAFFWLRFFAAPSSRLVGGALLAGLAPHLIFAAYLNALKFDVFSPFTYGPKTGVDSFGEYVFLAWIGAGLILASLAIDISNPRYRALLRAPRVILWSGALVGAIGAFALAGDLLAQWARGFFTLVIDIQAYDGGRAQAGLLKDAQGYWVFWGLPKKALLQSLPFLPLLLLPIAGWLSGRKVETRAFMVLMIAAPICFFSIKSFQGGMSYNMRYFLPCLPFIALLAAEGVMKLRAAAPVPTRRLAVFALAGVFAQLVLYEIAPLLLVAAKTPLQLYPQIIIAAALCISAGLFLRRQTAGRAKATAMLALLGFGYAAALNISDGAGYLHLRAAKSGAERIYANTIPAGALVFSHEEDWLTRASLKGAHVARLPREQSVLQQAIKAYENDQRRLFAHGQAVAQFLAERGYAACLIASPEPHAYAPKLYAIGDATCAATSQL